MRAKNITPVLHTQGMVRSMARHSALPLLVAAPHRPLHMPNMTMQAAKPPRRISAYLFFLLLEGSSAHNVDMELTPLQQGQLLFIQPNQIHQSVSNWQEAKQWYKLMFEEECLTLLPRSYDFLHNPLHQHVIVLDQQIQSRLVHAAEAIATLISAPQLKDIDLIIAHLNVFLSELNNAYFQQLHQKNRDNGDSLDMYIAFKQIVEKDFRLQPSVADICRRLAISESKLYGIVRQFSGFSPKKYLLKRTLLEAQRILYYDRRSVKQVAYELGFNDPDHFSKLFRKNVGKTPTAFLDSLQDLYSK